MLALPVVTASGGFFPALFIFALCWIFMTCTGLLLLELCLKLPPDANLVTMGATYLGNWGRIAAWGLYLFLFYCLSVAYICGGGSLLQSWLGLNPWICQLIFLFTLAPCVYAGAKVVDRLNRLLMVGLIVSYILFVIGGVALIDIEKLQLSNWTKCWPALPVIFTSFSYQGVIPSLTAYLHRNARHLRIAIIGGTSLAFLIYVIWEALILGTAKESETKLVQAFAFFAIATSFLGVTLGLFDFLADSLTIAKRGVRKFFLALLTFLPPLGIALINPNLFITALVFAGGIGCALLLGLMPILMVWVARYRHEGHGGPLQLVGGKALLIALILFVLFELSLEILI
jgi:tyrosine-specific transport protein